MLDFRGVTERAAAPCAVPSLTVHSLPIEPTIVQVLTELITAGHRLTPPEVVGHMRDTYRGFVRNNTHRFAELFAHLLVSDEPTVFHCTAGKDRTGLAAALVLRSLGVSEADVMRDYLLTNERLKPLEASRHGLDPAVVSVLSRVQPEFLQAAFEVIATDHGGFEAYLRDALGVGRHERERLRELYLEPGPALRSGPGRPHFSAAAWSLPLLGSVVGVVLTLAPFLQHGGQGRAGAFPTVGVLLAGSAAPEGGRCPCGGCGSRSFRGPSASAFRVELLAFLLLRLEPCQGARGAMTRMAVQCLLPLRVMRLVRAVVFLGVVRSVHFDSPKWHGGKQPPETQFRKSGAASGRDND